MLSITTWFENSLEYISLNWITLLIKLIILVAVIFLTAPIAKKIDHLIRRIFINIGKKGGVLIEERRAATVGTMAGSIVRFILWMVGVGICLMVLGLDKATGALVGAAGIGGLIVGFGAQKIIQDFIAGVTFVIEHPFSVGDLVKIGGVFGTIESVKLRTTIIRSFNGEKHILPNGSISAVTNLSTDFSLAMVEIYLPSAIPMEKVNKLLLSGATKAVENDENVIAPPEILGITAFTERGTMCVRTICRTKPATHFAIERAIRAGQLNELQQAGILGESKSIQ